MASHYFYSYRRLNRFPDSQRQLGLTTGAVFAVPIPEGYEAVGQELQQAVQQALVEAEEQGVHKWGKAATPWLLKRVGELTSGKSLASSRYRIYLRMTRLTPSI